MLVSILDGSTIDGLVPGMRGVLGTRGFWMLELVEGFLDVCGHGDVTSPFVVVPINGETKIKGASPVDGDSIQLLDSLDDIIISFFADVFDTKVVDQERKVYTWWYAPKGKGFEQRGSRQTWKGESGAYCLQCGRPVSGLACLCGSSGTPIRWMQVCEGCTGP